jgi:hypothetical protein
MRLFENLDWDDWLYGMWAAVASGASGSVLAGLFVNTVIPNVTKGQFWTLLVGFFVLGGVKDFFLYINKNPTPKRIKTKETNTAEVGDVKIKQTIETDRPAPPEPEPKKD